jgi:hypothetical protein
VIAFGQDHLRLSNADGIPAESVFVSAVSENYFQALEIAPLRGRSFDAVSPSVLISENYWQKRFAGNPAVLGKTVRLNSVAVTIVGITPHDFVGTGIGAPDFWLPLGLEPLVHADNHWLSDRENEHYRLFARLASGVRMRQAAAEMTILAGRLRTLHKPNSDAAKPATVLVWAGSPFPLPLKLYKGLTLTILLVMLAAGMVLAVACANVASLQLARRSATGRGRYARVLEQMLRQTAPFLTSMLAVGVSSTAGLFGLALALLGIYGTVSYIVVLRTQEIGIRMAVGAQKSDVLWLILRESTRPVLIGLLAGTFLAVGASYVLRDLLYGLPVVDGVSFGGMCVVFLVVALSASYPPAQRAMRVDPTVALRYE